MHKGYFITGTDTGVGKTVVTAALAMALGKLGFKVGVMKPVESGCREEGGHLVPQDALFLRTAAGCKASLELITPYAFADPLTPAIAAERAGRTIDIDHIRQCYQKLRAKHDIVLVEGAGGLLAPLTHQLMMQDVAVALNLPLLIVARNVLGTINHTALTVAVACKRSSVLGVVLNHTEPPDPCNLAIQTNEEALRRWSKAQVYCQLPYIETLTTEALRSLGEFLVTDRLLEGMGIGAYPSSVSTYKVHQLYADREAKNELSRTGR